jgi:hypothetical protein
VVSGLSLTSQSLLDLELTLHLALDLPLRNRLTLHLALDLPLRNRQK